MKSDVRRNASADRNREVGVGLRLNMLALDHRGDPGALLGRKSCAGSSTSGCRRKLSGDIFIWGRCDCEPAWNWQATVKGALVSKASWSSEAAPLGSKAPVPNSRKQAALARQMSRRRLPQKTR
jgi:hypothetical protein